MATCLCLWDLRECDSPFRHWSRIASLPIVLMIFPSLVLLRIILWSSLCILKSSAFVFAHRVIKIEGLQVGEKANVEGLLRSRLAAASCFHRRFLSLIICRFVFLLSRSHLTRLKVGEVVVLCPIIWSWEFSCSNLHARVHSIPSVTSILKFGLEQVGFEWNGNLLSSLPWGECLMTLWCSEFCSSERQSTWWQVYWLSKRREKRMGSIRTFFLSAFLFQISWSMAHLEKCSRSDLKFYFGLGN